MLSKKLSVLLFSAAALVTPGIAQEESAATNTEFLPTSLSIPTDMGPMPTEFQVPSSVMSVLMTAVPVSYLQVLGDPDKASTLATKVTTEDWYKSLPSDVKSYLSSMGSQIMTATAEATTTPTVRSGGPATADSDSNSDSESGSESGSESSGAASETSTGGVPAPTGHLAAGAVGVAGMLGLIAVL